MRKEVLQAVEKNEDLIINLAQKMWENPEVGYTETFATKLSKEAMENAGFNVRDIEGITTSFIAEYGSGEPVIGILGEHDALPNLSQEVSASKKPVKEGAPGHGCGHNLLGAGAMGACVALKERMEAEGIEGTLRYYGCPAEELLSGKVWMAQKGVFNDLDICFTWHPMYLTTATDVMGDTITAMMSAEFYFEGMSSHAGAMPEMGRSAVDAMEIMNVGANYLREHTRDFTRIHYAPTGPQSAPNIVPAEASVWYYVRAPKKEEVYEIFDRLVKCAQGAAMMTETTVSYKIKADCCDILPNSTLTGVIKRSLNEVGPIQFDDKDREFAKELVESGIPGYDQLAKAFNLPKGVYLHEGILERVPNAGASGGSSDVGDVSYIVPTAQFVNAAAPLGTAFHSWISTAAFGSSIGHKAAVHAAKVLALGAYEAFTDGGEVIKKAKAEFKSYEQTWATRLPEDFNPYNE